MKPEFPELKTAIKLVRNFFSFDLMRTFAKVMNGNTIIDNEGLKPLNERYQTAYNAISNAETEALKVSQQSNNLTQRFYLQELVEFGKIGSFKEYNHIWLEKAVQVYNSQFPNRQIDFDSLLIYKLYTDGLVGRINQVCNFYRSYLEAAVGDQQKTIIEKPQKITTEDSEEPEVNKKVKTPKKKIKANMSSSQLILLFKLLYVKKHMDSTLLKTIHLLISENIDTVGETGDLSYDKIKKDWSEVETELNPYKFWEKAFDGLHTFCAKKVRFLSKPK